MSRRASLFVAGIILLSMISLGSAIYTIGSASPDWVAFVVLLVLAVPTQLYEAEHGRQSYYPHFISFFAAVLLLPLHLFALIIIIPHIVEWARERWQRSEHLKAWYIQPFNIATHLIAGVAAFLLVTTIHGGVTLTAILPPVVIYSAAALVYVLINHLIVGSVLLLARGISFADSRVMTIDSLRPDFILACLGTLIAVLWAVDPSWIVLALLPLVLMYQALHVPQLKQDAETDSKTGLWNARHFTKLATAAVGEAQRSATSVAMIMADLDYLRTINNTYGHLAGDIVITRIAKIIRETINDYDIAARFGGEEFTIALPGSDFAGAAALAERIRQNIEQTEFVIGSGQTLHATISMGIACFPQDGTSLTELTHAADIAVYYAKFLGRNRVVCTPDVPYATKLEYMASQGSEQVPPALPPVVAIPSASAHSAPTSPATCDIAHGVVASSS